MKRRVITAVVGIPALLLVLWAGPHAAGALSVAAAAVIGREAAVMAARRVGGQPSWLHPIWAAGFAASGWAVAVGVAGPWPLAAVAAAGALAALARLVLSRDRTRFVYALFAAPYAGLLLAHGAMLSGLEPAAGGWQILRDLHGPRPDFGYGGEWLALAIFTTFAVDTAAMLGGRAVGRWKLAPRISPGKTWEGSALGVAGGVAAAFGLSVLLPHVELAPLAACALGGLLAVTGSAGDLAESMLKRHAGVKDSGVIIPGHGGLLDRVDALLPNLGVVYWIAVWNAS